MRVISKELFSLFFFVLFLRDRVLVLFHTVVVVLLFSYTQHMLLSRNIFQVRINFSLFHFVVRFTICKSSVKSTYFFVRQFAYSLLMHAQSKQIISTWTGI